MAVLFATQWRWGVEEGVCVCVCTHTSGYVARIALRPRMGDQLQNLGGSWGVYVCAGREAQCLMGWKEKREENEMKK